jgi:hypothetical protein
MDDLCISLGELETKIQELTDIKNQTLTVSNREARLSYGPCHQAMLLLDSSVAVGYKKSLDEVFEATIDYLKRVKDLWEEHQ